MNKSVLLLIVIILLCSCTATEETEKKFKEAPELYPELTFVTVDELKEALINDGYEYKLVIYNICFPNHWWTKIIANELIPKWKSMDTTRVGLYLISIDCARLDEMDSFFIKNNVDLPRYVIRDSTDGFCRYKLSDASEEWIRLTKITQHICHKADPITVKLPFFTTFVLDRNNNIKLIETNYEGKLQIVPMPFELCPQNPDEIDFSKITKYRITRKSRLYVAFYDE